MNAYEIADELQKHGLNGDNHGLFNKRIQNMLRQQADRIVLLEAYLKSEENRIADLEKQLEHYKNKAEALDKKELELLAEIRSLEKDLHMIQRHYDQLDTQLHPESTK